MNIRLIKLREVLNLVSLSKTELYRRIAVGTFPKPVRLGPQRVAFVQKDVNNWILRTLQEGRTMDKNVIICHPQVLLEQLSAPRIDREFAEIWNKLPRKIQSATMWLASNWCVSRVSDELEYGSSIPNLEQPKIDVSTLLACEALSFKVFRLESSYLLAPKQQAETIQAWLKPKGHFYPLDLTDPDCADVSKLCAFLESENAEGLVMTNIREAVTQYIDRGWRPIRVKPGGKLPIGKGWQNSQPGPEKFDANSNVGIYLGPASGGLIDIDLDISEARQLAKLPGLFGDLPAFGRDGEVPGHRLVVSPDAPEKTVKFQLPSDHGLSVGKTMVLELRSRQQSVFPPSRYKLDDGSFQAIVWTAGEMPNDIPELQWDDLHRRAGLLAFLSVVACAYPREDGNRDEVCMALAGTLARLKISAEVADAWIVAIAELAGDDEAEQRGEKWSLLLSVSLPAKKSWGSHG